MSYVLFKMSEEMFQELSSTVIQPESVPHLFLEVFLGINKATACEILCGTLLHVTDYYAV